MSSVPHRPRGPRRGRDARETIALARRLMLRQYDIVLLNEEGTAEGKAMPLHDLRVAVRRLRALLQAFRAVLAGTPADALERRLDRFSGAIGPARDADAQMRLLRKLDVAARLARSRTGAAFLARQRALQREQKHELRRILSGRAWCLLRADLERFLQVTLGAWPRGEAGPSPADVAREALRKAVRRVEKRSKIAPRYRPRDVHRLRIACRKARYLAEFFGGVLDERLLAQAARRMKALQDALGDVHDIDILLQHLRAAGPRAPRAFTAGLQGRRKRHLARFRKAWKDFRRPRLQECLRQAIEA